MRLEPIVALVAVVLAGCLGAGPSGETATSQIPVARQAGVEDPKNVTVHVVDPTAGNASIAGARVVFFTKVAGSGPAARFHDDVDECGFSIDEPPFEVLASATTGPDGRVLGQVRAVESVETEAEWLPVNVAVIGPPGYTTEGYIAAETFAPCGLESRWDWDSDPGPEGGRITLHVDAPIYPTRETFDLNGTLGPTVAARAGTWAERSAWAPRIAYNQTRHLLRLETVRAELTWSNGADGWADLYLGMSGDDRDEPRWTGRDRFQGPDDDGWEHLAVVEPLPPVPLRLGPVTDQPVVTADGIDYRLTGELTFAGADVHVPPGAV